jgi:Protein of unknown function (DUF3618)
VLGREENALPAAASGRLSDVPRDPRQIQLEIDAARESLAATLDHLVYRSSPKRVADQGRQAALRFLQTPAGLAVLGGVGVLIGLAVFNTVRGRKR